MRRRVSASTHATLCQRRAEAVDDALLLRSAAASRPGRGRARGIELQLLLGDAIADLALERQRIEISWRWRASRSMLSECCSQPATDTVNSTDSTSGTHHHAPRRASRRAQARLGGATGGDAVEQGRRDHAGQSKFSTARGRCGSPQFPQPASAADNRPTRARSPSGPPRPRRIRAASLPGDSRMQTSSTRRRILEAAAALATGFGSAGPGGPHRHQVQPRRRAGHPQGQGRAALQGTGGTAHQRQGQGRGLPEQPAVQGQGRDGGAPTRLPVQMLAAVAVEVRALGARNSRSSSCRSCSRTRPRSAASPKASSARTCSRSSNPRASAAWPTGTTVSTS